MRKKLVLLLGTMFFLCGCGSEIVPVGVTEEGILLLIKWPDRPLWLAPQKVIPTNAESIRMEVTGSGLAEPLEAIVVRPNNELRLLVPAGSDRQVVIEARDINGIVVASALIEDLVIHPRELVAIDVELALETGTLVITVH